MSKVPGTKTLLKETLDLYGNLLIPFMKIRRDIWFPTEPEREETDGEHGYTLSMLAITLAERMKLNLDTGLIAKYALVHDLVEVHAGDVSARSDPVAIERKAQKEQEAFLIIKEKYLKNAPWIATYIEKYEERNDEESKFVYATDKFMGALAWLAGDGARWGSNYTAQDGSDYHRVVAGLRKKARIYPPLLDLFDEIHNLLDKKRPEFYEKSKHEVFKHP
jgi:5'-deoxynucleotidase YfbR-like HD superfamily hydrolase